MKPPVRYCAAYARKSTEEGLEQEFNTLDAQRDACLAYIASQKIEGWVALPDQSPAGRAGVDALRGTRLAPCRQRLHAAAEVQAAGKVFVNDANADAAASYAVASLRAGIERRVAGWRLTAFARVDIVADRTYAGSVIVAESRGRHFEPAAGRAWAVVATATAAF